MNPFKELHSRNKAIIDGEEKYFFECSEDDLETAIKNNIGEYIGSGHKMIVDGKTQNFKTLHHFFK